MILCICMIYFNCENIYAFEITEQLFDYTEVQDFIDENDIGIDISFSEIVNDFVEGDMKNGLEKVINIIKNNLFLEIKTNLKTIKIIISIVVITVVFADFSGIVKNGQSVEIGFFISYILIMSYIIISFSIVSDVSEGIVKTFVDFMKALLPVYLATISIVSGQVYATAYCEMVLVIIAIIEVVCLKIIVPAIKIYVIVGLINNITKEDILSKSCEFIGSIINFMIKTMFTIIIGLNIFQKLSTPISVNLNNTATRKIIGTISGMTSVGNGVTELVFNTGSVIRNSIGAGGFVVLCAIVLLPFIKIIVFKFSYQLLNALIQPISDKRITDCLSYISLGTQMLIKTVFGNFVMFMITIMIVCMN